MLFSDILNGQASIILPEVTEAEAAKICKILQKRIKGYFLNNKAENVFINLGVLAYPQGKPKKIYQLPANLRIKKIYVGQEIRRFRRFFYKINIEVMLLKDEFYSSHTIDISKGGVCLTSKEPLETDRAVMLNLQLDRKNKHFSTKARVAWIRDISTGGRNNYKIGLEFIKLIPADKQTLSKFINSIVKTGWVYFPSGLIRFNNQ